VEKLSQESGATVEFDKVRAVHNDQQIIVGTPWVQDAKVLGTVIDNGKAKKVIIFKYKRKKQYRVTRGHRQLYTAVKINEINMS